MEFNGPKCLQLINVLNSMVGITDNRKRLSEYNLLWLNRNLPLQFNKHPKFQEAMKLIKELIPLSKQRKV